jgi:GTP-binding protein LepA
MDLVTKKHGEYITMEYIDKKRVAIQYRLPLGELIIDFYDRLKSLTKGYASLDYQFDTYQAGDLVKLDILVNSEPVDALAIMVHRDDAYHKGQKLVTKLKDLIPRQMFAVPIQASIGKKIISRADVKALRKDVLAKCYGGDITRKKKLLEKQKKGKRRMKMVGSVEVPQEAFMALLSLGDEE